MRSYENKFDGATGPQRFERVEGCGIPVPAPPMPMPVLQRAGGAIGVDLDIDRVTIGSGELTAPVCHGQGTFSVGVVCANVQQDPMGVAAVLVG